MNFLSIAPAQPSAATLVPLLEPHAVPMAALHARYGALLELVRRLIGVVPNCDRYLEIWPAGFRTYNLLVPSALNLPFSLWGFGAPPAVTGLAMYAASRAAGCSYCSAHTCSFAVRRGAAPDKLAQALDDDTRFTPAERAAVTVARSLARVPSTLTATERELLRAHVSPSDAQWIVAGVAMMGFLNKFMDAVGVELEDEAVREVGGLLRGSGWEPGKHRKGHGHTADGPPPPRDSLWTTLAVLWYAPAALRHDLAWTWGVPSSSPAVGAWLLERTGHDFPVLARLDHWRVVKALATVLRDNLDPSTTVIGLRSKSLAALVYAATTANPELLGAARALATRNGVSEERRDHVLAFARGEEDLDPSLDASTTAVLFLSRAIAPSPAQLTSEDVARCAAALTAPALVEVAVWISVLQMLQRLSTWYAA